MASWNKELLPRENGELVQMQVPEIVSASRSTDIPAFYADWFFHRLKVGYSAWTNPFNGVKSYVSYVNTHFRDVLNINKLIVRCFWRLFDIILYLCSTKRRNHEENDGI